MWTNPVGGGGVSHTVHFDQRLREDDIVAGMARMADGTWRRARSAMVPSGGSHRRLVPRPTAVVSASHKIRVGTSQSDGGARTWRIVIQVQPVNMPFDFISSPGNPNHKRKHGSFTANHGSVTISLLSVRPSPTMRGFLRFPASSAHVASQID